MNLSHGYPAMSIALMLAIVLAALVGAFALGRADLQELPFRVRWAFATLWARSDAVARELDRRQAVARTARNSGGGEHK